MSIKCQEQIVKSLFVHHTRQGNFTAYKDAKLEKSQASRQVSYRVEPQPGFSVTNTKKVGHYSEVYVERIFLINLTICEFIIINMDIYKYNLSLFLQETY